MYGRLEVGISGWDEGSDWAMCLKKVGPCLFTWQHLQVSQEQKKSQNVYSVYKPLLLPNVLLSHWSKQVNG